MPKVSVIIPNYNHAAYLAQRIESILNQTYKDFEIIFLDDASKDKSLEVFKRFQSETRITRVILNTENSGSPFKQWDKGIREASGEYVWIAESDDYADPSFLEKLIRILDSDPSVGLVYSQSFFLKNSTIIKIIPNNSSEMGYSRDGREELRNKFILGCVIPTASSAMFRKSLYLSVGGVDMDMSSAGDWLFWVKILLVSNISFVSEPLNYFRSPDASVRATTVKSGLGVLEYLKVCNYIKEHIDISNAKLDEAFKIFMRYWVHNAHVHKFNLKIQLSIYRELRRFMQGRFSSLGIIISYFFTTIRYRIRFRTRLRRFMHKVKP